MICCQIRFFSKSNNLANELKPFNLIGLASLVKLDFEERKFRPLRTQSCLTFVASTACIYETIVWSVKVFRDYIRR